MTTLASMPDKDLLARMPRLVRIERDCTADVIAYLTEIDRRRLYLDAACRSLVCYCVERLGFSEDEAAKRVRVARVARRMPAVLDELRAGAIHLTGLWLLAPFLTDDNAESLLAEARGKTRRQIEELLARRFPRPDVSQRICAEPQQQSMPIGTGRAPGPAAPPTHARKAPPKRAKLRPLSDSRWSVQLSIGSELKAKIDETPAAAPATRSRLEDLRVATHEVAARLRAYRTPGHLLRRWETRSPSVPRAGDQRRLVPAPLCHTLVDSRLSWADNDPMSQSSMPSRDT